MRERLSKVWRGFSESVLSVFFVMQYNNCKQKVRFAGKIFDCVDDFEINEKVDVVVRPEDVEIVPYGEGKLSGVISSCIFKGVHYEMAMMVGRTEIVIPIIYRLGGFCAAEPILEN